MISRTGRLRIFFGGLLVSVRLAGAILLLMIGFLLLGEWVRQAFEVNHPLLHAMPSFFRYFLRQFGLQDVLHSGWMLTLFLGLLVNFLFFYRRRLRFDWTLSKQSYPSYLNEEKLYLLPKKREETVCFVQLPSLLQRNEARELFRAWGRSKVGTLEELPGGPEETLELGGAIRRYSLIFLFLSHVGILLVALGFLASTFTRFEGKVLLQEGREVDFMRWQRGSDRGWETYSRAGKTLEGYLKLPFYIGTPLVEISRRSPGRVKDIGTWLNFIETNADGEEELIKVARASLYRPVFLKGLSFHQKSFLPTGEKAVTLVIHDRKLNLQRRFHKLVKDRRYKLPDAEFQVDRINIASSTQKESVVLYYKEGTQKAKKVTLIGADPKRDPSRRKKSRHTFFLEQISPLYQSEILVVRDWGGYLFFAGIGMALLAAIFSVFRTREEYWLIWKKGTVIIAGQGLKPEIFPYRFARVAGDLRETLLRIDPAVELVPLEVRVGSR